MNLTPDYREENLAILDHWYADIKAYTKELSFKEAQKIHTEIKANNNPALKEKLLLGTLKTVYHFIRQSGLFLIQSPTFDLNDIINACVMAWMDALETDLIYHVTGFRNLCCSRSFFAKIATNLMLPDILPEDAGFFYKYDFALIFKSYLEQKRQGLEWTYADFLKSQKLKDDASNPKYRASYQKIWLLCETLMQNLDFNTLNSLNKISNLRIILLNAGEEYLATILPELATDFTEQYLEKDYQLALINKINEVSLTPRQKEALALRLNDNLSFRDIAMKMNLSIARIEELEKIALKKVRSNKRVEKFKNSCLE